VPNKKAAKDVPPAIPITSTAPTDVEAMDLSWTPPELPDMPEVGASSANKEGTLKVHSTLTASLPDVMPHDGSPNDRDDTIGPDQATRQAHYNDADERLRTAVRILMFGAMNAVKAGSRPTESSL
jgi:hypothetical protein